MKTKFAVLLACCAVCCAFLTTSCGKRDTISSTSVEKVTIAQFGDLLLYIPLYVADEEGLFKKQGLSVSIVSTGGDDKTYAAVISGSADFGVADPTFVAVAKERGQMGKVVGLIINGMPNYGVSIDQQEPLIGKPADLKGKTVASVPAPSASYALTKRLYELGGLPPAIHQVGPPGLVPALSAKQANYAILIEPWVSTVARNGGRVAFSLNDYFPKFALTGLTTSDSTIKNRPETIRKVTAALAEAVDLIYSDESVAVRVAQKRFPTENPEDLKSGLHRMLSDKIYPKDLRVAEDAWAAAIKLRQEVGDLTQPPQPMPEYVEQRFLHGPR